jgi:hypothetical protein
MSGRDVLERRVYAPNASAALSASKEEPTIRPMLIANQRKTRCVVGSPRRRGAPVRTRSRSTLKRSRAKVQVGVERGAEAANEGDRADPRAAA